MNGEMADVQMRRDRLEVSMEPFAALDASVSPGLEAEVADLGRFYATRAELVTRRAVE